MLLSNLFAVVQQMQFLHHRFDTVIIQQVAISWLASVISFFRKIWNSVASNQ
jgi:hypothetical protein